MNTHCLAEREADKQDATTCKIRACLKTLTILLRINYI